MRDESSRLSKALVPGARSLSDIGGYRQGGSGMAGEGSAALGAPELAGAMVNPRGFGKKASVGAIGGAVGAVAATAIASRSKASDVPAFGRVGYIAASETEVALIKTKSGALKMKVTDEVF